MFCRIFFFCFNVTFFYRITIENYVPRWLRNVRVPRPTRKEALFIYLFYLNFHSVFSSSKYALIIFRHFGINEMTFIFFYDIFFVTRIYSFCFTCYSKIKSKINILNWKNSFFIASHTILYYIQYNIRIY